MPFALTNEHVGSIANDVTPWIGSIARQDSGLWADYALLLLLGGVPWQCYFQRVNTLSITVKDKPAKIGQVEKCVNKNAIKV